MGLIATESPRRHWRNRRSRRTFAPGTEESPVLAQHRPDGGRLALRSIPGGEVGVLLHEAPHGRARLRAMMPSSVSFDRVDDDQAEPAIASPQSQAGIAEDDIDRAAALEKPPARVAQVGEPLRVPGDPDHHRVDFEERPALSWPRIAREGAGTQADGGGSHGMPDSFLTDGRAREGKSSPGSPARRASVCRHQASGPVRRMLPCVD